MLIDIDSLLNATDGWNLSLAINGNQFIVDPPPAAARGLLETILSGDSITEADRPELAKLIGPLIREPSVDVTKWGFNQLVGVAAAVAVHAREIYLNHSRGICRAVALAMRTPQPPNAAAATVPDAAGSDQAAANAAAPALDPAARKTLEDFIKLRSGVACPPAHPMPILTQWSNAPAAAAKQKA